MALWISGGGLAIDMDLRCPLAGAPGASEIRLFPSIPGEGVRGGRSNTAVKTG